MIDDSDLKQVILFSFKKQTFAWGELEMPYNVTLLDEQLELIQSLLLAFGQKPPSETLETWRKLIATDLVSQSTNLPSHWIFTYKPVNEVRGGLPAGFDIKFKSSNNNYCSEQTLAWGQLRMPALPSFIDEIIEQIAKILTALKQDLSKEELNQWKETIANKLPRWFQASPNAYIILNYQPLKPNLGLIGGVNLKISTEIKSIENYYHQWTESREGALFGTHADAKVIDIAQHLGSIPILDVGAGTGRNSLVLAEAGYPVDALELTKVLSDNLVETARQKNLSLNVIQGDIFQQNLSLPLAPYKLIILAEVIASHLRSPQQVRKLMTHLCELLQPDGIILFNTFLAIDGYKPPAKVRELAQFYWSYLMTRKELMLSLEGLSLKIIADESVHDYEKKHLPSEAWPPTSWFINWSTGRNVFPLKISPPMELRWITLQLDK